MVTRWDGAGSAWTRGIGTAWGAGIFVVKADGSGHRLLVGDAVNPAWSPDGQQLAFHGSVDPSEYFNDRPCTARTRIIDADGSNDRELEELGDGCAGAPRWSPDGTRLASVLIASTPEDPEVTWILAS